MDNFSSLIQQLEKGNKEQITKILNTLESVEYTDFSFTKIQENFFSLTFNSQKFLLDLFKRWKQSETVSFLISVYKKYSIFSERFYVLKTLQDIPLSPYYNELCELFTIENHIELKIEILKCIQKTKSPELFNYFKKLLNYQDIDIRATALLCALETDYKKMFTIILSIFSSGNDTNIKNILNLMYTVKNTQIKYDICDFLLNQIEKFNENPIVYSHIIKTLISLENEKVLDIIKDKLKDKNIQNLILSNLKHITDYNLTAPVEKFYDFLINNHPVFFINEILPSVNSQIKKSGQAVFFIKYLDNNNPEIINLTVKLIIRFLILNKKIEEKLLILIKKEKNIDYFADIFTALFSKNTGNNDKIIKLSKIYTKLPTEMKIKIIINFRKLPENYYASNLLYFLYTKDEGDDKSRATIASILGITGSKDIIPLFKEILKDNNSRVRANVVESIEMCCKNNESVINILMPFLQDYNNRVKANVAITLWNHGGLRMLKVLEKMLLEHEDKWHRASAAYALGIIKNENSLDTIIRCINSEKSPEVISNCIFALGCIKDHEYLNYIYDAYKKYNTVVRNKALIALSNFYDDKNAITFIFDNLSNEDKTLRDTAFRALIDLPYLKEEIIKEQFENFLKKDLLIEEIFEIIKKHTNSSFIDFLKLKIELYKKHKDIFEETINFLKNKRNKE